MISNGTRQFNDLKMYLKAPRKKEFYSEAKRKKEEKHRNHSVYYEPKKDTKDDDHFVLRLKTEHSEEKRRGVLKSKYNKIRPYNQNRGSKLTRNF